MSAVPEPDFLAGISDLFFTTGLPTPNPFAAGSTNTSSLDQRTQGLILGDICVLWELMPNESTLVLSPISIASWTDLPRMCAGEPKNRGQQRALCVHLMQHRMTFGA